MDENRELSDSVVLSIKTDCGNGSGFFIEENLIVTNIHVVAKGTSVSVRLVGASTVYTVEGVTAFDSKNDLVILKITGKGTPLPIGDSDLLQSGDFVQVVGCPSAKCEVTEGTVHGILRSNKWIRMKVKTADGISGGPVLNRNCKVIGIAVSGEGPYNHAIPANILKTLIDQAQAMESLTQWRERKQIRAYACLVQSKIKDKANNNDETMIADLDKAIQLNPDFFLSYFFRGNMKVNLGQSKADVGDAVEAQHLYRDAIDDYTQAIKLCSDYALAYNNRADAKYHFGKFEDAAGNIGTAQNLYQEAIININIAIELDSNDALFYHTRGQIMHAFGDYRAAIEDYEKACEKDPDYTDVCKDLELAKEALEQQEKAKN